MATSRSFAAVAARGIDPTSEQRSHVIGSAAMVTVEEFAQLARLSRRQIDRLRRRRPTGFPREYELGSGSSKYRRCPRFRLTDVERWLESRGLW
jgi:predicted DNA-binding transcriptional regulator AlpA